MVIIELELMVFFLFGLQFILANRMRQPIFSRVVAVLMVVGAIVKLNGLVLIGSLLQFVGFFLALWQIYLRCSYRKEF